MKSALLTLAVIVTLAGIAAAQVAIPKTILTCDPPSAGETVRGYVLYKKVGAAREVVKVYASAERRFEVPQPIMGGTEFTLTAYNEVGESDHSDPLIMPGRPGKPLNTKVIIEFGQ